MDTDQQFHPTQEVPNEPTPQQTQYNQQAHGTPQNPPLWIAQLLQAMSQFGNTNNPTTQMGIPTAQSQQEQKKPRHSLSHPDKFTNKDNSQYPQFRSLLEAKLRIDARAIGSEEERVWYAFGRLSEDAAGRIHPWMQYAQGTPAFTIEGFLIQMDQAFSDPQRQAKALSQLNSDRQGSLEFRVFLQKFEQNLLEAQGWGWDDSVKKGYLKAALNRELQGQLINQVEPKKYEEYTALLRMISDNLQDLRARDNRRGRGRGGNPYFLRNTATQPAPDSMDWEPTTTQTRIAATSQPRPGRPQQGQQQRAKWVDHSEIGRRMSEGSCLRCGSNKHMVIDCSLLPARNPNRQAEYQYQPSGRRQSNGQLPIRKPRTASANPTIAKTKSSEVKEATIRELEEWETDEDESGKE